MIRELCKLNGFVPRIPLDESEQKALLKILMIRSSPGKLSDQYYEYESVFIRESINNRESINVESINDRLTDNIDIYKGDITTIKADAIVNAANEKLLGCFIPGHKCIDNAIHLSAGLGLRNECYEIMRYQGTDESVGQAKITGAYNLPSNYVVHTVGPNLNEALSVPFDILNEQLRSCYISILKAVERHKEIKTLVFCSISTGVYGFPIEVASKIAMDTIEQYLAEHEHCLEKVVINVFSKEDYDVYKKNQR